MKKRNEGEMSYIGKWMTGILLIGHDFSLNLGKKLDLPNIRKDEYM